MAKLLPKNDQVSAIEMIGIDASDYAQRLFSRNIKSLNVGEGCLSLFLTADAKVREIFWLFRKKEGLLMICPQAQRKEFLLQLEQFHFDEKLEFLSHPMTGYWSKASIESLSPGCGKEEEGGYIGSWRGVSWKFLPGEEEAPAESPEWELTRIQQLIPRRDWDYDDATLSLNLGFMELCDDNKGCYSGQEVIERVRTRGGEAAQQLTCLSSDKELSPGAELHFKESPAGRLTRSIVFDGSKHWALGYIAKKYKKEMSFEIAGQDQSVMRYAP